MFYLFKEAFFFEISLLKYIKPLKKFSTRFISLKYNLNHFDNFNSELKIQSKTMTSTSMKYSDFAQHVTHSSIEHSKTILKS